MHTVIKRIERCGEKFSVWNKHHFGHVRKGFEQARTRLNFLQSNDPLCQNRSEYKEA